MHFLHTRWIFVLFLLKCLQIDLNMLKKCRTACNGVSNKIIIIQRENRDDWIFFFHKLHFGLNLFIIFCSFVAVFWYALNGMHEKDFNNFLIKKIFIKYKIIFMEIFLNLITYYDIIYHVINLILNHYSCVV